MPCHAMHPIQDLIFLESFSYELEFGMHFYMHFYLHKFFILAKSGCYIYARSDAGSHGLEPGIAGVGPESDGQDHA
jgi:hypothetical protein